MPIAPQINLETYSSRVYTCSLTLPSITYGKLYNIVNDGGSAMTGSGSHSIQYVGTSTQVNIALDNTKFEPAADVVLSPFNITYLQSDDNDTGTPGSNVVNGTMEITVRDTHDEFIINSFTEVYNEDVKKVWNLGAVTDLRPDNIDSVILYDLTITFDDSSAGSLTNWNYLSPGVWRFNGNKVACNAALSSLEFVPSADYTDSFGFTLQQQQFSDGIDQGTSSVVAFTVATTHDDFSINPVQTYEEDVTSTWNVGSITDVRSDPGGIDENIQYRATITFSHVDAIDSLVGWTGITPTFTFSGTKAECNAELAAVQYVPGADYTSNYWYTYQQQQLTNNKNQGTSANVAVTNSVSHDEFAITTVASYQEDLNPGWNLGTINDLALNKNYTITLTFDDANAIESITGWTNTNAPATTIWAFSGTKAECNTAIGFMFVVFKADYRADTFGFTYQQQQTTDGIDQGSGNILVTRSAEHDEFSITSTNITYIEDTGATLNVGSITDLAAGKQYTMTLTFDDDSGFAAIPLWTDVGGGVYTYSGDKGACNTRLQQVVITPLPDYTGGFSFTYQQQQTTDNINQGTSSVINVTAVAHNEYTVLTTLPYDNTNYNWNLGTVDDLAEGKIYTITIGLAGSFTLTGPSFQKDDLTEKQRMATEDGPVVMSRDGRWLASNQRFYEHNGTSWTNVANVGTSGSPLAIDDGGYTVGHSGGKFTRRGGDEITLAEGDAGYGNSVALSSDGLTAIVGTVIAEIQGADLTGTNAWTAGSTAVTGTGTLYTTELVVGDYCNFYGHRRIIDTITDDTNLTVTAEFLTTWGNWAIQKITGGEGKAYVYTTPGDSAITGTINSMTGSNTIVGSGTLFTTELAVDDELILHGIRYRITTITNDTLASINGTITVPEELSPQMRPKMNWTQEQILQGSDKLGGDEFGYAVALSSDGNTAAVGAKQWGSKKLSTAHDGDGGVYIFTRTGSVWTEQQKIQGSLIDSTTSGYGHAFGQSLDLSNDGDTLIVGSPGTGESITGYAKNDGFAYVFTRTGGVWSEMDYFRDEDGAGTGEFYGRAVHMSGDGRTAIVADQFDLPYSDTGDAYIYGRLEQSWKLKENISRSIESAGDDFGKWGGINDAGTRFVLSTDTNGWFDFYSPGGGLNGWSYTGTKADCNFYLNDNEYFHNNANTSFVTTYTQHQDTDGIDQGTTLINVVRLSAATYTRFSASHGATAGSYTGYAGGVIADTDDIWNNKQYTLRLIHMGTPNVTGYSGTTFATWDGPSQTLTLTGTLAQINSDLSSFSIFIDTAGTVTVNGELDENTLSKTVVSTDSYTITAS